MESYDFIGWGTRYGVRCADGVTLMKGAFSDCAGAKVPLVYQHNHTDPSAVIGHAVLEPNDQGVIVKGKLSSTQAGQDALTHIREGNIRSLSIYANNLQRAGNNVMHGQIREVSLVLAGANPAATITFPELEHGMIAFDDEATTCICHTNLLDGTILGGDDMDEEYLSQDDLDEDEDDEVTYGDLISSGLAKMTDEERDAIAGFIGTLMDDEDDDDEGEGYEDDDEIAQSAFDEGGMTFMPTNYNVFDQYGNGQIVHALNHDEEVELFADALSSGSFRDACIAHGIDNVDLLFPEAHNFDRTPQFIDRDQEWVSKVINGATKVPWFNLKSQYADITEDDARALGYITGNRKKEEVFAIFKRVTQATTIYKKQKIDRDVVLEIDFDVAAWMQKEMRGKLEEEMARAILIGDGREVTSEDHIPENNIRPIWKEDPLFTIHAPISIASTDTINRQREAMIDSALLARAHYRGSGNPTLFIGPLALSQMLLTRDLNGRRIYDSEEKIRTAMRVSSIVEVPFLDDRKSEDGKLLGGIIVNMKDYRIGAAKGGEITNFSDFDIDFNKYTYLIETRLSGALHMPYSAIVLEYPENVTPVWYTEGYSLLSTLQDDISASLTAGKVPTVSYHLAKPVKGDDPYKNGWFERAGSGTEESPYTYTASTDRVPAAAKNYFVEKKVVVRD